MRAARELLGRRIPGITPGRQSKSDVRSWVTSDRPVILDIGCNDGTHTRWFLELFPEAIVHCFEPDPRPRRRFAENVHDPRAHLYPIALSAEDGTAEFHQSGGSPPASLGPRPRHPGGWDYSGSIRRPKAHLEKHPWVTFPGRIEVPTRRLDGWLDEQGDIDVIDLIWADVQGAEVDLITGGPEAFSRTRYVFMEYSELELYEGQIGLRRILRMLPRFEIVTRYKDDVLMRNRKPPAARTGR